MAGSIDRFKQNHAGSGVFLDDAIKSRLTPLSDLAHDSKWKEKYQVIDARALIVVWYT
ncbi:hypothetical protein [Hespellia stercorisuis]|uniref:hypothetical protein n=1 Tax=Hespellia stercorisuis TaxID=180311 RepID=UPI0013564C97|nr:hypothetical protein [Hespellia stercorisuis]